MIDFKKHIKSAEEKACFSVGLEGISFLSEEIIDQVKGELSPEQAIAFDGLSEFLVDPDKEFAVLVGYAGVGKTYLLSKLIKALDCKVAMTAPTNKAVRVLKESSGDMQGLDVVHSTIHKLLGLYLRYMYPKNAKPFQALCQKKGQVSTINTYDILVVDEASMLDDDLFMLLNRTKSKELKIIFMGDPAQIPPVNKPDSIPLVAKDRETFNIQLFELSTIMRQKSDSRILSIASQIRDNRYTLPNPISDRESEGDVTFYDRNNPSEVSRYLFGVIQDFRSDRFSEDPNYCKVIAWRNIVVDSFNSLIRKKLFGENVGYLCEGEKLIADTSIISDGVIAFNTSDEFTVISVEEKIWSYIIPSNTSKSMQETLKGFEVEELKRTKKFKYYETVVETEALDEDGEISRFRNTIDILDPDYFKLLNDVKNILYKTNFKQEYEMMADRFAKVKYNYAITCHKAQGSTYNKVYLIEDDVDRNTDILERNRIKYTACTRAKNHLYILSRKVK